MMASSSSLPSLQTEIVLMIMEELDVRSLLAMQATCRRFRAMRSLGTDYTIELASGGVQDNPVSSSSTAARLQMLRTHQKSWGSLTWTAEFPLPPVHSPGTNSRTHYFGDMAACIVWDEMPTSVCITQLPSQLRGIEYRRWKLEFPFCTYPLPTIHFRSLSTGRHHMSALRPDIEILDLSPEGKTGEICGNYVALSWTTERHERFLNVWNWRTGRAELELVFIFLSFAPLITQSREQATGGKQHDRRVQYFSFLDANHIMVFITRADGPHLSASRTRLHVYRLGHTRGCWEFVLPRLPNMVLTRVSFERNTACYRRSARHATPFLADGTRLISIRMTASNPPTQRVFEFQMLSQALISHIGGLETVIAWEKWGSSLRTTTHVRSSIHGARAVHVEKRKYRDGSVKLVAAVSDYHPLRVGRAILAGEVAKPHAVAQATDRSRSYLPRIMKKVVLPEEWTHLDAFQMVEDGFVATIRRGLHGVQAEDLYLTF
ncbi:hypothetical protein BV25DRAFT_645503 [Artomyces pyxidatus]|uniref:Uncharacterized protein n=1 Tax=Artomyces pyxidatus TaxID=48021 RepID=A0ACB8T1H6_9AGAM|nr:hypothetical protein BV25DRAFT_645503 [Artomyces pyxidatus]